MGRRRVTKASTARSESAELRSLEQGEGLVTPVTQAPASSIVDVDTLLERTDLGHGIFTLVRAGGEVPAHLAHLPRSQASDP